MHPTQYYVAYTYYYPDWNGAPGIHFACDLPFATGPVTYRTVVSWRENIAQSKHPGAEVTILSWQALGSDA